MDKWGVNQRMGDISVFQIKKQKTKNKKAAYFKNKSKIKKSTVIVISIRAISKIIYP